MEFTGKSLLPLKKFCLKKLESDLHPLFIRGWGQNFPFDFGESLTLYC